VRRDRRGEARPRAQAPVARNTTGGGLRADRAGRRQRRQGEAARLAQHGDTRVPAAQRAALRQEAPHRLHRSTERLPRQAVKFSARRI
jgi:hypothetical protein